MARLLSSALTRDHDHDIGPEAEAQSVRSSQAIDYGTQMVAGVNPKKAGQAHLNLPIFGSVRDAAESTGGLM